MSVGVVTPRMTCTGGEILVGECWSSATIDCGIDECLSSDTIDCGDR